MFAPTSLAEVSNTSSNGIAMRFSRNLASLLIVVIQCPWGTRTVHAGAKGSPLHPDTVGRLHLTTTAGAVYHLFPK